MGRCEAWVLCRVQPAAKTTMLMFPHHPTHTAPTPLVRLYTKPAPDHSPLPFPNFRTPAGVLGWEDVRPGFCCQVQPAKTMVFPHHTAPTPLVRPYTKPAPEHSPLPFPNFRTPAGVLGWEDVRPGLRRSFSLPRAAAAVRTAAVEAVRAAARAAAVRVAVMVVEEARVMVREGVMEAAARSEEARRVDMEAAAMRWRRLRR